jgi:hypothetical protein
MQVDTEVSTPVDTVAVLDVSKNRNKRPAIMAAMNKKVVLDINDTEVDHTVKVPLRDPSSK